MHMYKKDEKRSARETALATNFLVKVQS